MYILTISGLPITKSAKGKRDYGRAELIKHGLMLSTGIFFFRFTNLGLLNKVFFSVSKYTTPVTT